MCNISPYKYCEDKIRYIVIKIFYKEEFITQVRHNNFKPLSKTAEPDSLYFDVIPIN